MRIAFVASSHGFGHAARCCAVIESLRERCPDIQIEVFTEVPEWFFADSLAGEFGYHRWRTDIGLVQTDSLSEDIEETCRLLADWLPFSASELDALAGRFLELHCNAVVADISPLALVSAKHAGLPSILLENFTWDWIYRGYGDARLDGFAAELEPIFEHADLRIQTEPCCRHSPLATTVGPISRQRRATRIETRERLGIPPDATLMFVTMGGIAWDFSTLTGDRIGALDSLPADCWLVLAGAEPEAERRSRIIPLPHHSPIYHPDLVRAADVVVGKLGYSTVAEVHAAGCFFAYVGRPQFVESAVLEAWVEANIPNARIGIRRFVEDSWLDRVLTVSASHRAGAIHDSEPKSTANAGMVAQLIERFSLQACADQARRSK